MSVNHNEYDFDSFMLCIFSQLYSCINNDRLVILFLVGWILNRPKFLCDTIKFDFPNRLSVNNLKLNVFHQVTILFSCHHIKYRTLIYLLLYTVERFLIGYIREHYSRRELL